MAITLRTKNLFPAMARNGADVSSKSASLRPITCAVPTSLKPFWRKTSTKLTQQAEFVCRLCTDPPDVMSAIITVARSCMRHSSLGLTFGIPSALTIASQQRTALSISYLTVSSSGLENLWMAKESLPASGSHSTILRCTAVVEGCRVRLEGTGRPMVAWRMRRQTGLRAPAPMVITRCSRGVPQAAGCCLKFQQGKSMTLLP